MAKITITLTDHESGHVHIKSDPDVPVLIRVGRAKQATPAETYAMIALRRLVEYSGEVAKEKNGLIGVSKTKLM